MNIKNYFIASLAIIGLGFMSSCNPVKGEGALVSKDKAVDGFDEVSTQISGDIVIRQGDNFKVSVRGQENILPYILIDTIGKALNVTYKPDAFIGNHKKIQVFVTMPSIHKLTLLGSGGILIKDTLRQGKPLQLLINGSGSINIGGLYLPPEEGGLKATIDGSGDINIKGGKAAAQVVGILGSGSVDAANFEVAQSSVRIAGSGNAKVKVSGKLEAEISGSGNVYYLGNPKVGKQISGSGQALQL